MSYGELPQQTNRTPMQSNMPAPMQPNMQMPAPMPPNQIPTGPGGMNSGIGGLLGNAMGNMPGIGQMPTPPQNQMWQGNKYVDALKQFSQNAGEGLFNMGTWGMDKLNKFYNQDIGFKRTPDYSGPQYPGTTGWDQGGRVSDEIPEHMRRY
tara:strand:- start:284 stop:736 length:453 start_codon:yes stop_codon:yes gene_type:complete